MNKKFTWGHHPGKHILFGYAESLVDRDALAASVASHLATCRKCAAEVDAMRASLEFAASAPALDPSADLRARILLAARQERHTRRRLHLRFSIRGAVRVCAYAAALLLVAGLAAAPVWMHRTEALTAGVAEVPSISDEPALNANQGHSLREITSEIKTLANAVQASFEQPRTARERVSQRTVNAMDAEIAAAMAALERNPGCVRASNLVHTNLERQAEALRTLYVERSL